MNQILFRRSLRYHQYCARPDLLVNNPSIKHWLSDRAQWQNSSESNNLMPVKNFIFRWTIARRTIAHDNYLIFDASTNLGRFYRLISTFKYWLSLVISVRFKCKPNQQSTMRTHTQIQSYYIELSSKIYNLCIYFKVNQTIIQNKLNGIRWIMFLWNIF